MRHRLHHILDERMHKFVSVLKHICVYPSQIYIRLAINNNIYLVSC